jgi:hypothetical protein
MSREFRGSKAILPFSLASRESAMNEHQDVLCPRIKIAVQYKSNHYIRQKI